jgi:hypothetical protein
MLLIVTNDQGKKHQRIYREYMKIHVPNGEETKKKRLIYDRNSLDVVSDVAGLVPWL